MPLLQVTNFKRYQSADIVAKSHGRPPWVKMHREFFIDYEQRKLKPDVRLLALFLTSFASEFINEYPGEDEIGTFPNDAQEIARRVALPLGCVKKGLAELESLGFLSRVSGREALPASRDSLASPSPPRARDARSTSSSKGLDLRTTRARKPDEIWDALVEVMGYSPATKGERGKWNSSVGEIREAGGKPEDVAQAAREFKRRYPDADLTPKAISTNWSALLRGRRELTAEQRAERERARLSAIPGWEAA